jgi:NADPH-dependent glutamate synthase beta subunit-like oxidoreductase
VPTLTINNQPVQVDEGTTLLQAARAMDIEVPTLCYWEGVRPMNSCMLCVMRNADNGTLVPSCSTVCVDGMNIETDSGDVANARKDVLELIISEHVGDCEAPCSHTCPASMNIPVMMREIYDSDYDSAAYTVTNGLVFPWTLGYICPAPCENPCRRKSYDDDDGNSPAAQDRRVEIASSDNPELLETPEHSGKKCVAIVGAGITGMSARGCARKFGHAVHVIDERESEGRRQDAPHDRGRTAEARARFRNRQLIEKLGVKFEYGREVNGDLDATPAENYDIVILACNDVGKPGGNSLRGQRAQAARARRR